MTTQQSDAITEMFPIPTEARRLERFLGDWTVQGSLTMDGSAMPVSGMWRFTPAAAGWGVQGHFDGNAEGMGHMEEDDLLGYDPETGLCHLYSLTNTGNVHDHAGRWTGDDSIELVYTGTQQTKPFREVVAITLQGGEVRVSSTEYLDGQQTALFEATFRK